MGCFFYTTITFGQYNTLYQHYFTPISGQALTVIDENNVRFDSQGKIYTLFDRESLRYSILTCMNTSGGIDWIDTLTLSAYLQSSNANFTIADNRIYMIGTYGNNLNSSIAEAVAITKYDLDGHVIHQKVLSNPPNMNFRSQEIYVLPNTNIIATYLTNEMMTNWTLHVDCYDSSLVPKWNQSFAWPSYSNTSTPGTTDNLSNFFISYTTDSVVASNYYRKMYLHKIDSNGVVKWTRNEYDTRYKFLKMGVNGLMVAGETIAPLVIVSNNIGDVFVKKIDTTNGNQLWNITYNATSNEKEIVNSMDVGINTNIMIGGTQDIQDVSTAHYKGFVNIYTYNGVLLQSYVKPTLEVVNTTRFLSGGNAIVRSSTATDLHINEYTPAGIFLSATNLNFVNGASWAGMDFLPNDDIALAVSDVLCSDRGVTTMRLSKNAATGLSEQQTIPTITVYPNPCTDQFFVDTKNELKAVEMYNALGEKVNSLQQNKTMFSIKHLPAGMYTILVITDEGTYHTQLVKE
jgi:hypothetical protein